MKRDDAIAWLMRTTQKDEDVYPLVARDIFASALVMAHAQLMRTTGVARASKVDAAIDCAAHMDEYEHKWPD